MSVSPASAFDLEAQVLADLATARTHWVPLAVSLHAFHSREAWRARGAQSFNEWLAAPEVGIGYRTAKDMIDAVQELAVNRAVALGELALTDASKIAVVLPALRAGSVGVERALADCRALTRADLRDLYRGERDDALDAEREPAACVCGACGRVHRAKGPN